MLVSGDDGWLLFFCSENQGLLNFGYYEKIKTTIETLETIETHKGEAKSSESQRKPFVLFNIVPSNPVFVFQFAHWHICGCVSC